MLLSLGLNLCNFLFSVIGYQSSIRAIISKHLICITFSAKSYFIMLLVGIPAAVRHSTEEKLLKCIRYRYEVPYQILRATKTVWNYYRNEMV